MADDETGSTVRDDGLPTVVSTTWVVENRKIASPPQAHVSRRAQRGPLAGLLVWPRRRPLTLTIKYRGGPEAWYEIRGRGRTIRRSGHTFLHDLMREFYRDGMP